MTPADHYERATELLETARTAPDPLAASRLVHFANVHATLATVPWGGREDLADDVEPATVDEQLVEVLVELDEWTGGTPGIPAGVDAEAWVAGYDSARRIVGDLVRPVLATVEAPRQ